MKNITTPIALSILILTLSACNYETDTAQQSSSSTEQQEQSSDLLSPQVQLPSVSTTEENNKDLEQNEPFALDDFRNAIDSVVQDSIQEEVEKAVEDEISKNTSSQK